jgi:hypothetical protein
MTKEQQIKEINDKIAKLEKVLKQMEEIEMQSRILMAYLEGLSRGMVCRPFWGIF